MLLLSFTQQTTVFLSFMHGQLSSSTLQLPISGCTLKLVLFCYLQEAFRHIDIEIPLRLIKFARAAGVGHCSLLTSVKANPNSWFLYFKSKGVIEESCKELKFPYTSIFRPGVIDKGQSSIVAKLVGTCVMCICRLKSPIVTVQFLSQHQSSWEWCVRL